MYEYKVLEVMRVVDGDTIDTRFSFGFGGTLTFRFRLFDFDAPELTGRYADSIRGPEAKTFVEQWLENHWLNGIKIKTERGSQSTVGIGDGAFGRWLATFIDMTTGETLQDAMREAGHVK